MRTDCSKRDFHPLIAPSHLPPLQKLILLGHRRPVQTTRPLPIQMLLATPESQTEKLVMTPAKVEMGKKKKKSLHHLREHLSPCHLLHVKALV